MRIIDISIENLCQHRKVEFAFAPGLNAIIGPNGSGKSNILKMLYAAMTNDFTRNVGPKDENICQAAEPRDKVSLKVRFEHGGVEYGITRGLRPNRQVLEVPGEPNVTRDNLVNDRIARILGVSPEILDQYIFVDQWRIFDFLGATEASRAKDFQKLFGTMEAERLWKLTGDYLAKLPVPQAPADVEMLEGQALRLRTDIRQTEDALADPKFNRLPESLGPDNRDRRLITDFQRRAGLNRTLADLKRTIIQDQERLAELERESKAFEADLQSMQALHANSKTSSDEARAALANWQTAKRVREGREKLVRQIALQKESHGKLVAPVRPAQYIPAESLPTEIQARDELMADIRRTESMLKSFSGRTGLAECPTCFTPVANLVDQIRAAQVALPDLKSSLVDFQNAIELTRHYDAALARYEDNVESSSRLLASLEQQLLSFKETSVPTADEPALRSAISEFEELDRVITEIQTLLNKINTESAGLFSAFSLRAQQKSSIEKELASLIPGDEATMVAASVRLNAMEELIRERAQLRGSLSTLKVQLERVQADIARYAEQKNSLERDKRKIAHFNDIRSVLHRDNLPRIVAQHYLRQLEVDTNAFLGEFQANFRVEADDSLSFRAIYHDGRNQPAGRMSGGEKVVLAVAFRLSVNSMFARDVGLLCLDEPTVGLDDHNLGCLDVALQRLREMSRQRGLQVILVTHERGLGHLFDKVLDLNV